MVELPDVDQAHQTTPASEPPPSRSLPRSHSTAGTLEPKTSPSDAPESWNQARASRSQGLTAVTDRDLSPPTGPQQVVEGPSAPRAPGRTRWKRTLGRCAAYVLAAAAVAALLGGTFYGWAVWQYGSPTKALARLQGQVLILERDSAEIPCVPEGVYLTGYWEVENLTDKRVTIVGSRSGCGCVVAEDLPMSIEPRARQTIRISAIVSAPKEGDVFAQPIQLCLDTPSAPVVAMVRAKVMRESSP